MQSRKRIVFSTSSSCFYTLFINSLSIPFLYKRIFYIVLTLLYILCKHIYILILACFFAKYTFPAQSGPNFGLNPLPPGLWIHSLDPTTYHRHGLRRTGHLYSILCVRSKLWCYALNDLICASDSWVG